MKAPVIECRTLLDKDSSVKVAILPTQAHALEVMLREGGQYLFFNFFSRDHAFIACLKKRLNLAYLTRKRLARLGFTLTERRKYL
jgi:hypothetical protein